MASWPEKKNVLEEVEDEEFVIVIEETKDVNQEEILKKPKKQHSINDFTVLNFLGEGAYAKVTKVFHKETNNVYALKAILKAHVKKVCSLLSLIGKEKTPSIDRKGCIAETKSSEYSETVLHFPGPNQSLLCACLLSQRRPLRNDAENT
eukprot:TRINITY_DN8107_c0_g1_i3.p2 TRINITY_DN8107_c0_g1~~TRINITY_DN8107_c0_g1_i3.p2  ORF type:complete len:149 (+),score=19.82 TRINITY_DN8107_c0_g1_i3:140-586(+)